MIKEHQCKHRSTCRYRSKAGSLDLCDYIGITGKARGCTPDKCDKYERKTVKESGHQERRMEIFIRGRDERVPTQKE